MKRLIFVIPVLFIAILSCSKSKPKGILSESEMADMMTEVYTVDGYLNVVDIDSARKLLPVLYQHVFDRYKIDSTQFDQNVDYYYGNPVMLEKLMTEVQKKLTEQEREARRQDSISQVQVRDSIMVVQRWRQLEQEAKDRILSVHIDTTMRYDLVRYSYDFFAGLGLNFERYRPNKPMPKAPVQPNVTEDGPDEEVEVTNDSQPEEIKVDPDALEVRQAEEAIRPVRNRPVPTRALETE